jgi:RNA polymerase sigma factor (sigma-70 family)
LLSAAPDDALAAAARQGDREALAVLTERYWPLLQRYGRRFRAALGDADEGCQIAALGFLHAVRTHVPGQLPFAQYSDLVITRRLISAVRSRAVVPPPVDPAVDTPDTALWVLRPPGPPPEAAVVERDALATLHALMAATLTPLEYRALLGRAAGYSTRHIAAAARCTEAAAKGALQRARAKMRAALRPQ